MIVLWTMYICTLPLDILGSIYHTCNEINYRMTWDPHYKCNNALGSPVNYLMYVIVTANPFLSRICNLFQIAKHILPFKQFVQLKWLTCKIISAPLMVIFSLFSHPFELFIAKPSPHCSAYCFMFSYTVPSLLKLFSLCIPCHRKHPEQTGYVTESVAKYVSYKSSKMERKGGMHLPLPNGYSCYQ